MNASRSARPREHDVARLVTHQQGPNDVRPVRPPNVDDADAVGEVINHPELSRTSLSQGDRLHAHRHGPLRLQVPAGDAKDLDAVVRRVRGVEVPSVGREHQRPNLAASNSTKASLAAGLAGPAVTAAISRLLGRLRRPLGCASRSQNDSDREHPGSSSERIRGSPPIPPPGHNHRHERLRHTGNARVDAYSAMTVVFIANVLQRRTFVRAVTSTVAIVPKRAS